MGTIQLDAQMPQRFGLTYMGPDNTEHTPYVIHRALLGSLERFIGILIEHYARRVPVLARAGAGARPAGRRGRISSAALAIVERLREAGYRVEIGEPTETIGKRIRASELEKIPFTIVFGDRESEREPRDPRARRRARPSNRSRISSRSLLRLTPEKQGRTRSSPPGRRARRGVQPSRTIRRWNGPLHAAAFLCCGSEYEEE